MKSEKFKIYELVPMELFKTIHEDVLWNMFDPKLIETIDAIKRKFPKGSIIINNYKWGGDRNWSGLRTRKRKYYSETSQHSLGKAVDMVFTAYDVDEVRQYIIDNQHEFPHIKGIELDVGWLHVDTREREDLFLFRA